MYACIAGAFTGSANSCNPVRTAAMNESLGVTRRPYTLTTEPPLKTFAVEADMAGSRRTFLKVSGLVAAGMFVHGTANADPWDEVDAILARIKPPTFPAR